MLKGGKRLKRINVVVPIYEDFEAFKKLLDNINRYLFMFNHHIRFIIVDDTPSTLIKEMIQINKLSSVIRYVRGSGNYGRSVLKGMMIDNEYDKLILMDVDHPFCLLPDIISLLDVNDVVIGNDININDERKVTKFLLKYSLGINVPHPTCGYMGFNSDVLGINRVTDKTIKFFYAMSKRDMVHVEFLFMCVKRNLLIGVVDFDTKDTRIKHNYGYMRSLRWLKDLFKTMFMDRLLRWYE
jgi:hypothetical protein